MGLVIKRSIKKGSISDNLPLRRFHEIRNKILIIRQLGGAGDLLMHRMIFEDIKKTYPELKLVFACLKKYHGILKDHPYIDEIVDCKEVKLNEYLISYNTTTCCGRYENQMAPLSDWNRSDIWANHCGIELKNHDMHINISPEDTEYGKQRLREIKNNDLPSIVFCPTSAMSNKNLVGPQITDTIKGLRDLGLFVYGSHTVGIKEFEKMDAPVISECTISQWMGVINAADYVLSVDTAAFHLAGGLKKPLTGVYSWADGKVYGKYYDFALVQKHRDNGNWSCGPCYKWADCPKECTDRRKPCITELTSQEIISGVQEMLIKWPLSHLTD